MKVWRPYTTSPGEAVPRRRKSPARDRRRRLILGAVAVVLIAGVALLHRVFGLYIDWLWFDEVDQLGVFWTALWWRLVVGLVAGAVFFVIVYLNIEIAFRLAPDYPRVSAEGDLIEPSDERLKKAVRWVGLAGAAVVAIVVGYTVSADWLVYALALRAGEWGTSDAQFGRDLSFYVFSLPALQAGLSLLLGFAIAAIVASGVVHLVLGGIEYSVDAGKARPAEGPVVPTQRPTVDVKLGGRAIAHLSALFAAVFILVAVGQLFKAWDLLFSPGGVVFGATYTDANVRLPIARITLVLAFALAVFLIVNVWRRRQWWPVIALVVWVIALVVLRGAVPAVVQQLAVNPNELNRERPYITRNLEATRSAFNLDIIEQQDFPAARRLEAQDLADDPGTLRNIRLWDPETLRRSYTQLQQLRPYYTFLNVDIDRYTIDDVYRQTMLAARELNLDGLPPQARTWVNEHITYTHGFGVAMSAVNQVLADGSPDFLVQDVPPRSVDGLEIEQPRIYYGESPADYKLVRTTDSEFDYPGSDGDVFTEYEGTGGIEISPWLRRLAFGWRFGTIKFFTTSAIRDDSRIIIRNDIMSRVERLAPFLTYDGDPYMVISEGRLYWIIDAYTTTDRYPYSQPAGEINYVRNATKIVVDAYNGAVKLYAFDDEDPMLQAYRAVFPDLFAPRDEMPVDLVAHMRYPEDLFNVQAEAWTTYHVESPDVLYNKGDQWQIPQLEESGDDGRMRGYYVIMRLPGEKARRVPADHPVQPERTSEHGRLARSALRPAELRYLHQLRLPPGDHPVRPQPGRGDDQRRPGDLGPAYAVEPAGLQRDPRQPARGARRRLDPLRPAAVPRGRDHEVAAAQARHRLLSRAGRRGRAGVTVGEHAEHPGRGAHRHLRPLARGEPGGRGRPRRRRGARRRTRRWWGPGPGHARHRSRHRRDSAHRAGQPAVRRGARGAEAWGLG